MEIRSYKLLPVFTLQALSKNFTFKLSFVTVPPRLNSKGMCLGSWDNFKKFINFNSESISIFRNLPTYSIPFKAF